MNGCFSLLVVVVIEIAETVGVIEFAIDIWHQSRGAMTPALQGGPKMGGFPLARQDFVYLLTLDEFQNSLGDPGKNFGSMNMDEFLKNIWTTEEIQAVAGEMGAMEGGMGLNFIGRTV